ncbi:acetoacetate--CoA ligase [Nocardia pseudovaccinii]|uniref:acetoacetate--CoA ligase n=1 Tax=Nocardia pseudovaccinii TaxID=189540 RepID=UPI0009FBD6BF|nr:acetoacetate--CoA ligase [Nocardia pseudovaccinii]
MTSPQPSPVDTRAPGALWSPRPERAAASAMAGFARRICASGAIETDDYERLWSWSVRNPAEFWASLWEFFGIQSSAPYDAVLANASMPGAQWFPGARLNYAEHVFRNATAARPALRTLGEDGRMEDISWDQLGGQVASLAAWLRSSGVRPGDRVAGYVTNTEHAVVGLLAAASIGAVWSCCPPDYGTQAVIDRFRQIEPVVLLAVDGYTYGGKEIARGREVAELVAALPSVRQVITVPILGVKSALLGASSWSDVVSRPAELVFEQLPFDHPLWILYSSGTTGLPKGIVHGHGGILLEHLKWLGLHNDVRPGDMFFWYTTSAWMIWNVLVSSLLTGATAVLYDGSPVWPGKNALWRIVARTRATHFGTSAGYLTASAKADLTPGADHVLSRLRCIMSTGSPLPAAGWQWVYDAVKPDVWLDAPSGGTDVCAPYVGGNPMKPVHAGRMQCRFLGTDVQAWSDDGEPVVGDVGELVVTAPMPSMPLYFIDDPDGRRYHEAYFDVFPGVWRHGDWLVIHDDGTAEIRGRSDSTINRHGVRMGSADIYAVIDTFDQVEESLVIGAELPDGGYYMPLFVVPAVDCVIDDDLRAEIADRIRAECSPRHVPDEIIEVPAIPHTLTGKRLEVPVKRLIQGVPMERAVNAGVVDRPELLGFYADLGARLPLRH